MLRLPLRFALAAGLALVFAPAPTRAQPTPVQEYRQLLMESLDAHNGAVRAIVGGEVSMAGHLAAHARGIQGVAGMLLEIFPEGSEDGTRASPDIWDDWEDFTQKVMALQEAAAGLVSAAETGDADAVAEAAQGVNASCRSCHQAYRLRRGG